MSLLEIENVTLRFGGLVAVDNVSLTVERGRSVSLSSAQMARESPRSLT